MSLVEWKQLGGLALLIFFSTLIAMYILGIIIENKQLKRKLKTRRKINVDTAIVSNYNEFIKEKH